MNGTQLNSLMIQEAEMPPFFSYRVLESLSFGGHVVFAGCAPGLLGGGGRWVN